MQSFLHHDNETDLQRKCCEWFLASRHALMSYARRQVDDGADVELLLMGVAEKVTLAVCSGKVPLADIAPYAMRSLYVGAVGLRRKSMRTYAAERRYCEEEGVLKGMQQEDTHGDLEDEHVLVSQAMRDLPEMLYTVVTLRLWHELTFAEIAAKLHINERTVRRYYCRGLKLIKEKFHG